MNNWRYPNDELPECNGWYIVEIQTCDIPDERKICCDYFKHVEFGYAQFVNKWMPIEGWVSVDTLCLPPENLGVLVYIPDEDDHITSGMWDTDEKWVLLDEYRVPDCKVTHWMMLPEPPKPIK